MPNDRVTSDDVALRAGVSRSTVSRAFSPGRPVQEETRQRILRAAQELGYHPNALAQALTSRRSQIVGIVMGELSNPIHAVLHQSLSHALQSNGFIPISAQLSPPNDADQMIATFRQYQVNVIILTSMNIPADLVTRIQDAGLQVLLLNRVDEDGTTASVSADMNQGGLIAARYLADRGCRQIVIAQGPNGHWTSRARFAGHLTGLERMNITPMDVLKGGYTYEDGAKVADILAARRSLPDGILCPNDLFAIGLMDRLRSSIGSRFPQDMRVIGFDDIPMANWVGNQLTTIRLPVSAMATRAAELIARIIAEQEPVHDRIWLPCRLTERASA
ncbi:LacI family DNA-binding transcriptional regulator [Jannaschia sp. M317]|uniref:LacI family DNA-binding transcriptional regulator n=1 Tax=Jannaschia sp. M317 TaxID=2867011 RepID=UPI0021A6146A|nr:LacI family DNA-binding transcriptional regulator [Jannaschia sp. M317]UWQ19125.1 LacI family DNA-binding transcriptional regulator [Jannaschia sp. M317]